MKKFLSLCLICALLFSCIGCAGQGLDENTPVSPETDSTTTEEPLQPEDTPPAVEPDNLTAEVPEEPYVRVIDPAKPMVALTFDDGPHVVYSHAILDVLEEYHGVATFFEVARNIPSCPDALVRMLEIGCEVASHSNAHQDLSLVNQAGLLADLDKADSVFISATGQAPTMLRPPYGAVNNAVKMGSGRSVFTWTIDTQDWMSRDAETIVSYVKSLPNLDGEILLMHSTYESTVKAVEMLIPWLMEQGYQLVTVTELMAYYYGEFPQPNKFYGYTYFSNHGRTDTPLEIPEGGVVIEPVEIPVIDVPVKPNPPKPVTPPPQQETPVTPPADPPVVEDPPVELPPVEEPPAEQPPEDLPPTPFPEEQLPVVPPTVIDPVLPDQPVA